MSIVMTQLSTRVRPADLYMSSFSGIWPNYYIFMTVSGKDYLVLRGRMHITPTDLSSGNDTPL